MSTEASNTGKIGRPRGFDQEAALEAAMRVFWAKSYEGATMSDLTEAMGINRSSMYAAFGDKETLFRRAIERYRTGPMTYIREALALPTLPEVVTALLHGTVQFLGSSGNPRGCLSLQATLASGTGAEPARDAMIEWRKQGEAALKKRVQQAQRDGDLDKKISPSEFAPLDADVRFGRSSCQRGNEDRAEALRRNGVEISRLLGVFLFLLHQTSNRSSTSRKSIPNPNRADNHDVGAASADFFASCRAWAAYAWYARLRCREVLFLLAWVKCAVGPRVK